MRSVAQPATLWLRSQLMSTTPSPPRLFVIFASGADEAIIFRRGPSQWYHLVRWNTRHDTLDPGAWLRGRIYEDKCDLSADGRLLLYFVHQGRKARTAYTDAWTGVSRTPWLTALGLWPLGTTYGGGGRFTGSRKVMLRHAAQLPHRDHAALGLQVEFGDAPLQDSGKHDSRWQWSGCDREGRLVFALDGCLFRRSGKVDKLVVDLRSLEPDPKAAPHWATRPLVSDVPRSTAWHP
jgi:hypothetical protein